MTIKKWKLLSLGILAVVCLAAYSCTPTIDQTGKDSTPTEKDNSQVLGGPYYHQVLSASSRDGLNWIRDAGVRIEHASVPCAVADGDRILLYYVDADRGPGQPESVGCALSTDGQRFEKQPFVIEGLPTIKAVDPCVLRDTDGKFRLYYLASSGPGDPATEEQPHEIHLAVSDDGIRFRNVGLVFRYPRLVDPDVFVFNGMWFMYVFGGGQTLIATSVDGYSFTYRQPLALPGWGTVSPVKLEDGRLRLYAFDQGKKSGNAVRSFISTNGLDWTAEAGDRLVASENEQITDPFVIRWKDGYRMFFKVEKRTTNEGRSQEGQPPGNLPSPPLPSTPAPGADGPWNHRVLLATSQDGLVWKVASESLVEQASVPELFLSPDGYPIVLFVDASGQSEPGVLGAIVRQPDGSWARKQTNLRGADPNVVQLRNGGYRAYTKEKDGSIQVYSSGNGLDWQLLGEAFRDDRYPQATDPDVFETPSGWVMLISLGPRLLRGTSMDGIKFTAGEVMDLGGSVSDTVL